AQAKQQPAQTVFHSAYLLTSSRTLQPARYDFSHADDAHRFAVPLSGILQHPRAGGAAASQRAGAGLLRCPVTVRRHRLQARLLFFPELRAAGAAAEAILAAAFHFQQRRPGLGQRVARRVEDAVVAAQVAGVVEGDLLEGVAV